MDIIKSLSDPKHVQRFQQFCGLEFQNDRNLCQNGHSQKPNGLVSNGMIKYDDVRLTRNGIKNGLSTNGYKNHNFEKDINANHNINGVSTSKQLHQLKSIHNNSSQNDTKLNGYQNGYSKNELQQRTKANGYKNGITQNGLQNGTTSDGFISNDVETIPNGFQKDVKNVPNGTSPNSSHPSSTKSAKNYKIKYSLPYYLAAIGAFMGDEIFYLTFYPFIIWNMDSVLGRQTVWVWTLVMYFGQATKDFIKVPRPSSPPVIQLETHHLNEFSLPSTHAMAGTAMPVVMAFLLLSRYEFPVWLAISCVPIWTILTCLSRLYLGVHTILDVICGILYALLIVAVTLPFIKEVDIFIQSHPLSPIVVWIICLAGVTVCYPAQGKDVAKGSGVRIVAIYMGFATGLWINYHCGISVLPQTSLPYSISMPSLKWVIFSLLRFILGAVFLALVKLVLQKITVSYFSYLANLEKPNKLHPSVETSYIISTYSVVGFFLMTGVPYIFEIIGLSCSSFSEIY